MDSKETQTMAGRRAIVILRCLLAATLLFVSGAASAAPIGEIIGNPREYVDKTVTIEGEVTGMFSLLVVKYFTVSDGTARINVITDRPLPRKGQRIRVTGKVSQLLSLGASTLLVLLEDEKGNSSPRYEKTGVPEGQDPPAAP